jgi:hypothetical protein
LNPEMHGLPIFPALPGDIAETVKYSESKWNTQHGPDGRKRSLYIYQQRTMTMPFMQVFDSLVCDESRPRRRTSVTPLQALSLYNGDFINGEIRHFASRVKTETGDNPDHQLRHSFNSPLAGLQPWKKQATLRRFANGWQRPPTSPRESLPCSFQRKRVYIHSCGIFYETSAFLNSA